MLSSSLCAIVCTFLVFVFPGEQDRTREAMPKDNTTESFFINSQKQFEIGLEDFKKGNIFSAQKALLKALGIWPMHAEASFLMGLCMYEEGNYAKALDYFTDAKDYFQVWRTAVNDLILQSKISEQTQLRLDLDEAAPEDSILTGLHGHSRAYGTRESSASQLRVKEGNKPIPSAIPAEYYLYSGNCYLNLKNYERAFSEYNWAIERDPEMGQAYYDLAVLCYLIGDDVESWLYLQTAKEKNARVDESFEKALVERMQSARQ